MSDLGPHPAPPAARRIHVPPLCCTFLATLFVVTTATASPVLERQIRHLDTAGQLPMQTGARTKAESILDTALLAHLQLAQGAELRRSNEGAGPAAHASTVLSYQQWFQDLPVYGTRVSALLDTQGRPRALVTETSPASGDRQGFIVNADTAIQTAVLKHVRQSPRLEALDAGNTPHQTFRIRDMQGFHSNTPARAQALWYPLEDRLEPAWEVEISGALPDAVRPLARTLVISARDGTVLRDIDRIHDLRPLDRSDLCLRDCGSDGHAYRVFTDRAGNPYADAYGFTVPHPTAVRDGWRPHVPAPMNLVRLRHGPISTGDPWLEPDATQTLGNNVDAFFHGLPVQGERFHPDAFVNWGPAFNATHDHRAPITAARRFDHAYDANATANDYFQIPGAPAQPVPLQSAQFNARIVQGFYAANWLHDLFHEVGFDEAAGNMQADNFGRGGIGGDRLIVNAGFLATFAMSTADGVSPALVMGLNASSMSNRDTGAFDFSVFAHEWAHTMIGRLVRLGHQGQQGALHEGTADFIGMFLLVDRSHRHAAPGTGDFHGAWPFGAYNNLDYDFPGDPWPPAGTPQRPDNTYYHGVRRFPYSASLAINPLTFAHISAEHPLPDGFEPFDWKLRSFTPHEIHSAGEVWASALWQCARNILAARADREFARTHRQILAYLVAALKLLPLDATFTEARDAMLLSVRAGDPADYLRCRAGFAERGLGAGAQSPSRDSIELLGVVQNFEDADPPALR